MGSVAPDYSAPTAYAVPGLARRSSDAVVSCIGGGGGAVCVEDRMRQFLPWLEISNGIAASPGLDGGFSVEAVVTLANAGRPLAV